VVASPIPEAAPVTITTLSLNLSISISYFFYNGYEREMVGTIPGIETRRLKIAHGDGAFVLFL